MEHYRSEIIYKKDGRGKLRMWTSYVTGDVDDATLHREYGLVDGTPVISTRNYTVGKNIGRSNETTALEQAILEAKSYERSKMDTGYHRMDDDDEAGSGASAGASASASASASAMSLLFVTFLLPALRFFLSRCLATRTRVFSRSSTGSFIPR